MGTCYRFGAIEVRPDERAVFARGRRVRLGGRAFDLLLVLLRERNRVVPKSELMDAVWPAIPVEENNLHMQVSALRKVLGREAVTTVSGRGYRFTAPVRETETEPG